MKNKVITLNKERNVTLTPFIVSKKNTPCILILPGGAYSSCEQSEGEPVAKRFNELGFNCFILCYSVGKHYKWPLPLEDYEQAVAYISENKDKYHIDMNHLVVMGFSAGGHLASAIATVAKTKPYAAVLCYAPTDMETLKYCAPDAPETWKCVDKDTCPCYLVNSRNDFIVPSFNLHKFMDALEENFIDYEAHIYGYSVHGFGVGQEAGEPRFSLQTADWPEEFAIWLYDLMTGRYTRIRENCDYVDTHSTKLSSKNSCKVVFANKDAERLIKRKFPLWYLVYKVVCKQKPGFMDTASMFNLMHLLKCNPSTIEKMDEALSKYPVNIL